MDAVAHANALTKLSWWCSRSFCWSNWPYSCWYFSLYTVDTINLYCIDINRLTNTNMQQSVLTCSDCQDVYFNWQHCMEQTAMTNVQYFADNSSTLKWVYSLPGRTSLDWEDLLGCVLDITTLLETLLAGWIFLCMNFQAGLWLHLVGSLLYWYVPYSSSAYIYTDSWMTCCSWAK